ncbi:MAG: hypothetical protein K2K56_04470 [Lachnospiraceae bacterium]|nr:hypothetical protein [Lachnospiraceae bacterium]
MRDCIARDIRYVIRYIRRLCDNYIQQGDGLPYMEEKGNISFDLLVKTVCATLTDEDPGEWKEAIQEIRKKLGPFTKPKGAEIVSLSDGDGETDIREWNKFFSWSLFQYTYILVTKDDEKRMLFLWRTILLPYIHTVNKNSSENVNDEIENLLKKYPIVDGDETGEKTLEKLKENIELGDDYFWNDEEIMVGPPYCDLPTKGHKGAAAQISKSGWECLTRERKEQRG